MSGKRSGGSSVGAKKPHAHKSSYVAEIALIIALPEERSYFRRCVDGRSGWTANDERQRFDCRYDSAAGPVRVRVATLDGMGHIPAVLGTSSTVSSMSPRLAIMVGIAGTMQPAEVGLGDVVISNQAKFFASDKVAALKKANGTPTEYLLGDLADIKNGRANGKIVVDRRDRFLADSFFRYERGYVESCYTDDIITTVEPDLKLVSLKSLEEIDLPDSIRELESSNRERKVHGGWLLGGNHVVDSKEYREYLNEKNKELALDIHRQKGDHERVQWKNGELLAVDMESYGFLKAVELARTTPAYLGGCQNLIGGIVVRGISDLCEEKSDLDASFPKNDIRRIAVENATEICLRLIEGIDYQSILFG